MRPMLRAVLLSASAAVLLSAGAAPAFAQSNSAATAGRPVFGDFGFDVAGMDRSVKPGDDFFGYADGTWDRTTEIPADKSRYTAFGRIADTATERTRTILQEAADDRAASGERKKIGDLYASFIDTKAIDAKGVAPLKPELDSIAAIQDRAALARVMGAAQRADVDPLNATNYHTDRPFGLWVGENFDKPTEYAPYLLQGGLWLPDRDYYLEGGEKFAATRAAYVKYVANLLRLAGWAKGDADARAARILELETAIARAHVSAADSQDIHKANNHWTRGDLRDKAPGLDWNSYLNAAGLTGRNEFIIWQPSAFTGVAALAASEPLEVWKDYLAFHAIARAAPYLSQPFADESFAFNGKVLSGAPQERDRWKRAVDAVNGAMGEAVGKIYVERHFAPDAKAKAQVLVKNLLVAFDRRIDKLDWMSPETKARAKAKLATMSVGVGYPDRWRSYQGLEIRRDDLLGNMQRAGAFEYAYQLKKLDGPVDRDAWHLLPQEVNALNSPLQNSIIFPAAILNAPFFDPNADPAINYGGIGGVIGHEISHGFDDIGALFDAEGRLHNWWTPEDFARFQAEGKRLSAQYGAYQATPDLKLNGDLTLGENIADVAGLATAYDAYLISLEGKPAPVLGGFTGEQRVFLGWAQIYREKAREAALRRQVLTDPHSPGPFRVRATRNIEGWYQAFDVKPGDAQYLAPADRVNVW